MRIEKVEMPEAEKVEVILDPASCRRQGKREGRENGIRKYWERKEKTTIN